MQIQGRGCKRGCVGAIQGGVWVQTPINNKIRTPMFGFATAFKSLKIIGLSFLAIEANNLRFINVHDLGLLVFYALGELIIFLYLSNKFLKYENK